MTDLIHALRREANTLFEKAGFQGRPPFLRRAQSDDFLLSSDAPKRLSDAAGGARLFRAAGLIPAQRGGLWFLDARKADYERLDASLPMDMPIRPSEEKYLNLWSLCRMLYEHPGDTACQPLWAVRRVAKAVEAGEASILSLADYLPPYLAELLRKKEPLPALAGKLLAEWLNRKMREERGQ